MNILQTLAREWQPLFRVRRTDLQRFRWLLLTLQAIIVPVTISRTSNLLRGIAILFGVEIAQWRYLVHGLPAAALVGARRCGA